MCQTLLKTILNFLVPYNRTTYCPSMYLLLHVVGLSHWNHGLFLWVFVRVTLSAVRLYSIKRKDEKLIDKDVLESGCGLRYCPSICLEGRQKIMKNLSKDIIIASRHLTIIMLY